jgi:glutamine amidotransferase
MCRFVMYLGEPIALENLITKPVHSLINQSYHAELRDPLNGDGFGVAWYEPEFGPEPAVFRAITPAWNNRNLLHLARVTRTECALAHVRAASHGLPVVETNCHPFTYGRLAFMHNGAIAGFPLIKRAMLARLSDESFHAIEGSTDSEHLFALFLDHLREYRGEDSLEAMGDALEAAVETVVSLQRQHDIGEESQVNVAVSDGVEAVALRYTTSDVKKAPSMYWHEGRRYECKDGNVCMLDPDVRSDTVIVASEPLSLDYGWEAVAPQTMLLVKEHRRVHFRQLRGSGRRQRRRASSAH